MVKKLQETQEEMIILEVGNQQFYTSRMTMRADTNSLLVMLFCRPTYYFDRDLSHFRFIIVKEGSLPRETRYLVEM